MCRCIAIIVQQVAAASDAGAVGFSFLRPYVDGVARVGDAFVGGNGVFLDPFQHIDALNVVRGESLEQSAHFVFARCSPSMSCGVVNMVDKVPEAREAVEFLVPNGPSVHGMVE